MSSQSLAADPGERSHALELEAQGALNAGEASALLCGAADVLLQKNRELKRAETLLRRASAVAPQALEPLKRLRALYEQTQSATRLAEVLERLAHRTSGPEAATLLFRAAEVYEKQLNKPHRAILCLQLAGRADPKRREAFRRVRKFLLAEGHGLAALDSIERERTAFGEAGMAGEYAVLAERLIEDPPQHDVALHATLRALELDPVHATALKLKKTFANFELTWRDRVRTLRGASLEEQDRHQAARLSLQVAKLFGRFEPAARGKVDEALERCFLLWPGMPDAAAYVEKLGERDNDFPRAALKLEELALRTPEPQAKVELLLRAGTIRLQHLSETARALEDFRLAHTADPRRADATTLAAELAVELQNPTGAAEILEAHLAATGEENPHAVTLHQQVAQLYAGPLKAPARARAHLERALALDESNLAVSHQLARLLAESGETEALARLLPSLDFPGPFPLVELLERCAGLFEQAQSPAYAAEALARALMHAPERVDLLPRLLEDGRHAPNPQAVATSLRKAAAHATGDVATPLWRTLAELLDGVPSLADDAQAAWAEVRRREGGAPSAEESRARLAALGATPNPEESVHWLSALHAHTPADPEIAEKLTTALSTLGRHREAAEVARTLMEQAPHEEARTAAALRLARLYVDRLERGEDAVALLLPHLSSGGEPVLGALQRIAALGIRQAEIQSALAPHLARSSDRQREAAALFVELAGATQADHKKKALVRLAELNAEALSDPNAALGFLLRAIALAPDDAPLIDRAWEVAARSGTLLELGRALEEAGTTVGDDPSLRALLFERASAAALAASSLEESARWAEQSLASVETLPLIDRLVELSFELGRPEDSAKWLRRRLLLTENDAEKCSLYQRLAELEELLGRFTDAATALEEAVKHGPIEAPVLPRLTALLSPASAPGDSLSSPAGMAAAALTSPDGTAAAALTSPDGTAAAALPSGRGEADAVGTAQTASPLLATNSVVEHAPAGSGAVDPSSTDAATGDSAPRDPSAVAPSSPTQSAVVPATVKHAPGVPEGGKVVETALRTLKKQPQDPSALAALELWSADAKVGVAAARGLAAALKETDPPRALAALEVLAERAETGQERLRALREAARIQFALHQPSLALAALARAVRIAPHDAQLLREAERMAEASDCLEVLAEVLEELEPSAAIHVTLARTLEKLSAPRATVLAHLHAARAEAPQDVEVLRALVLQHRAHDEWAALAKVLEALPAVVTKPEEKLAALREVALVYENRLLDKGSAAAAWRGVAEYDPSDPDAVMALERLYTDLDRPQDLLFALELGRNQADGSARGRELSVKLALLKANRLGELSEAVTLCQDVLAEDAGSASAREALEAFVSRRESAGGSALAVLDPLLAQAGDHARRAALREARSAATTDASERDRLTSELRALYEQQLQQPERAFMAAVKAFSAGQGDRAELIDDLTRLAATTGMHEELAEIFEGAADGLPPGDSHLLLLLRRAAVAREAISDLEGATRLWNALIAAAPTDIEALRHLSQLYEKGRNAKNLSEVYARQAALAEDPLERRRLLLAAAAAYEDSGADEAAVEALRSALVLERSADVLFALERLYGKLKRSDEQAESLSALVGLAASAEERFSLGVRLGQILERTGKEEAAAEAFHAAVKGAPENTRTSLAYSSAVASLQRLFDTGKIAAGLEVLETAHRARGDRRALAEVLEKRAESGGTLEQFSEIAALRESLGERLAAFAARLRGFAQAPNDEGNRQELERLATELDSPDELAAAYEDRLDRGADPVLQQTLWRRLAQLHEGLGRTDQAGRAWEELARRSPAELEPLQALARIYTKGMAFRELSEVLLREVELESETSRKVDLLVSAANVAEVSLRDTRLALRCYRTVLALSPGDLSARQSVERLLMAEADHAGLAGYYQDELALEGDPTSPRALELKVTLARIKAHRLAAPNEALSLLHQILSVAPDQPNALKALQELLVSPDVARAASDLLEQLLAQNPSATPQRTELLEAQIRSEPDRSRRAALLRRLAEEQSGRQGEAELAFLSAARALREAPEDTAAVVLCLRTAEAADSSDALEELLEELGPTAPTSDARLFIARTWARLRERNGADAEPAWRAVLAHAPDDAEAQAALEKALRTPKRAPELVKLLKDRLAQTPGSAPELLQKIAMAQELAGDIDGAVLSLQQAFAHSPSPAPLQQLEQLLGRTSGRGRERAEVLSRLAALSNEPEGSFAFLLSRAQLLESLGELDAAVMAYGEVLASPAHADAAVAALERHVSHESGGLRAAHLLEPVLRARGDQKRLVTVLEARVPAADKPTRRRLLEEIASLREQVGQTSLAFAARARAVLESPSDEAARAELERVASASGLFEELVDTYEDLLERDPPAAARLALRRRLAELLTGPVPRPAEALAAWEEVSREAPEDAGALAALADAYRRSGAHPQLVAVLFRQVDVEPNVERQVERLFEIAELSEGPLGRDDLAIDAYQQILERSPTERGALRSLQSAFERARRFGDLADAISREIALLRSAEDVDAALDRQVLLGTLHAERLNDPHTALATYSSVLSARPQHEAALTALEGMVLNGSLVAIDAAKVIEPLLDQQNAHKRLVGVLEAHVRAEPRPADRAALLRWMAGVQGSALRNPPAAFLSAARALREAPGDPAALELCLRLAQVADAREELVTLLEEITPTVAEVPARSSLLRALAKLQTDEGDTSDAIASWRALLQLHPADDEATGALEALLSELGRWSELVELLTERIGNEKGRPRVALLMRRGHVQERAGDDAGAVLSLTEASELLPTRDVLLTLARVLDRTGQRRQQAELLATLAELPDTPEEEKRLARMRRAALLEELHEPLDASEGYAAVLQLWPDHAPAVEALRRLVMDPSSRQRAAHVLEARARSSGDGGFLLDVVEALAEGATASPELISELSGLYEQHQELTSAFGQRIRLLQARPEDEENRAALDRLAPSLQLEDELAAAYEEQAEQNPQAPSDLILRLAKLNEGPLAQPAKAARFWERLSTRPEHAAQALEALERIYLSLGDRAARAGVIERTVALQPTPEAKIVRLRTLATLAEGELEDFERAARVYRELLQLSPDDAEARPALARLLAQTGQAAELAELIQRDVDAAQRRGDDKASREHRVRLAKVRLLQLDNPEGAMELLAGVLAEDPDHPETMLALEDVLLADDGNARHQAAGLLVPVYERAEKYEELAHALETLAEATELPSSRSALLRRVATLHDAKLKDSAGAYRLSRDALSANPDDPTALELCLELSRRTHQDEQTAALLQQLISESPPRGRMPLRRADARLHEGLWRPEAARAAWRSLLEVDPTDGEALEGLARSLEAGGSSAELLQIRKRQLLQATGREQRVELLQRLSTLQQQLGDEEGALESLRRLLDLDPGNALALEHADRLCERLEKWDALAGLIEQRIRTASTPAAALALRFRLAELREARLADRTGALALFREVLEAVPGHRATVARLETMLGREPRNTALLDLLINAYRSANEGQRLAAKLEARALLTDAPEERKALFLELASVVSDPGIIFVALFRAFCEDPSDVPLRERLSKAAHEARTQEDLANLYERELPRIQDPKHVAQLRLELGEHYLATRQPKRAAEQLEQLQGVFPEKEDAILVQLEGVYRALDQPVKWAEVLERRLARRADAATRSALLTTLAGLQEGPLAQPAEATATYEQVLALEPKNLETAGKLERLYASQGNTFKRLAMLELQITLLDGAAREATTLTYASALVDAKEPKRAVAIYRELLERSPRHPTAFALYTQALEVSGELEELCAVLVERISRTLEPTELATLHAQVGNLLHRGLKRPEEAITHLKAALERAPTRVDLLESLCDVYESLGRADELAATLRRLLGVETDATKRSSLRLKLGDVLAGLGRTPEALDVVRPVLDDIIADGGTPNEIQRLGALYERLQSQEGSAQLLEARAAHTEDDGALPLLHDAATRWLDSSEPERAAPVLERILAKSPRDRVAFDQASAFYATHAAWPELATLLEKFLPNLAGQEHLATLLKLADLQETRLARLPQAVDSLCAAVRLAPHDRALRARVEKLAEQARAEPALAKTYEAISTSQPWGESVEQLLHTLAQLYDRSLNDPTGAESSLRRILDFDPTNTGAMEALEALFTRRKLHDRYVQILEDKLQVTGEIAARQRILRDIARAFDERMGDSVRAAAALERSIQLSPTVETIQALIELHRRGRRWKDVVASLGRARQLGATSEERAARMVEAAAVQEKELNDIPGAILSLKAALEDDGTYAPAYAALERLYTGLDRPADLLALYERQLAISDSDEERVALLRRCAALSEVRQKNLAAADRYLETLVGIVPADLDALRKLTVLKRTLNRPADLAAHTERVIPHVARPEQVELLLEQGALQAGLLKQPDKALAAYTRVLELDARNRGAMSASADLHERARNWAAALELVQREARAVTAGPEAADLHARMGRILDTQLKDRPKAKNAYQEALRLQGSHDEAAEALLRIYEEEGNWSLYERTLTQRAQSSELGAPRARALVAVGRFFLERRKDREGARSWFEQAIRAEPDNADAAAALAELYLAAEDWLAAERMLDVVVRDLTRRAGPHPSTADAHALATQLTKLGEISLRLGEQAKSLKSLEAALKLNPTYLPALRSLGNLRAALRQHAEAQKIFESMLVHHRAALAPKDVSELYVRSGELFVALGENGPARSEFERALAVESRWAPALRGVAPVYDALGLHDRSLEARQRLLPLVEGEEKYRLCLEIANLTRDKVKNPTLGVDVLLQALKLKPGSVEVLDRLYHAYRTSHQGQRAADTLQSLLRAPEVRADLNRQKTVQLSLAETYRDELRDTERAASAFNAALDLDWKFLEALRGLEKLYTQAKRWRELEDSYQRMIRRIPDTAETLPVRMTLWRTLAELQLHVLAQPDKAIASYQVVAREAPTDAAAQEQFALLAAKRPGMEELAAEAFRRAAAAAENPAVAVVGFASLAARRKRPDAAYLAAQAATVLLQTTGTEERELVTRALVADQPKGSLTDRLWKSHLLHPQVRGPLGELVTLLSEQLGEKLSLSLSKFDLNAKKHRVELPTAPEPALQALRLAGTALGLPTPEVYSAYLTGTRERPTKRGSGPLPDALVALEVLPTYPSSLKVGGRLFQETGPRELRYMTGRALATLRPELMLLTRVEAPRLPQLLQAAIWLSGLPPPADVKVLEKERKFLDKALSDSGRNALTRLGREAAPLLADPHALPRYVEGAELTAMRAGALLAADVPSIQRMIFSEPGRVSEKAKLRDLILFLMSDDLVALRAALGMGVG